MNIKWYAVECNSAGKSINTMPFNRLKDANRHMNGMEVEKPCNGYIERQEWNKQGKEIICQHIVWIAEGFKPSAEEALNIRERITIPYPKLNLIPLSMHDRPISNTFYK